MKWKTEAKVKDENLHASLARGVEEHHHILVNQFKSLRRKDHANDQDILRCINAPQMGSLYLKETDLKKTSYIPSMLDVGVGAGDIEDAKAILKQDLLENLRLNRKKGYAVNTLNETYQQWKKIFERNINSNYKFSTEFKDRAYTYLLQSCQSMIEEKLSLDFEKLSFNNYLMENSEKIE